MTDWESSSVPGETPIDPSGLRSPDLITTRRELAAAEARNINEAFLKYLAAKPTTRSAPFDFDWFLELHREIAKMEKNLGGIKSLKGIPNAMFVIDPKKEHLAVREAQKLDIPVVALCDTNCDPGPITHVIPGNDDALKAIRLFTAAISDAVIEGNQAGTTRAGAEFQQEDSDVEVVKRPAAADAPAADAEASAAPPPGGDTKTVSTPGVVGIAAIPPRDSEAQLPSSTKAAAPVSRTASGSTQ